tara:strand:- start:1332 stop:2075 length:744 start_codon:yes stop_codon:yes gene_type:complete
MTDIRKTYKLFTALIVFASSHYFSYTLSDFIGDWTGTESYISDQDNYENKNVAVEIYEGGDREGYLAYTSTSSLLYNNELFWTYHYLTYDKETGDLIFLRRFVTPLGLIGSEELKYVILYCSNGMLELEHTSENREFTHIFRLFYTSLSVNQLIPDKISLNQNYPNPFNPSTAICLDLENDLIGNLSVFDINGGFVSVLHSGLFKRGLNKFFWKGLDFNGTQAPSGTYVYRMVFGDQTISRKMTLVR